MASVLSVSLLVQVVLIAFIIWVLFKFFKTRNYIKKLHAAAAHFHSLPKHWIWGTLPLIKQIGRPNLLPYLLEESKKHGKVLIFWRSFLFPTALVTHSQTIGEVLRSSAAPKNHSYGGGYSLMIPWLGDGLLVSGGKKWERHRKLLTPAFHFKVLQPYVTIYNEAVEIFMSKIAKVSGTGESFEVFGPTSLCTLDVMLRCAFSYEGHVQEMGESHPYVQAVKKLAHHILERNIKPQLYIDWIYYLTKDGQEFKRLCDYVHTFAEEIIEKRQKHLKNGPDVIKTSHLDFLDILLAARDEGDNGFTKEDMRAEVDTFLFEGHDTTASGASWAMYALAKYPDIQEKVYQEVHEILGDDKPVEWSDLSNLTYTGLFIKEAMRVYPPVPGTSRQLSKPLVVDGVELPAGMVIIISVYVMHHNPDVWENPEEFRPERFAEDKFSSRDPYSYVPFSAGPRNCIGQNFAMNELKVMVARLVNRFRMVLDTDHPVLMLPELILRTKHGIKIKFYPRT